MVEIKLKSGSMEISDTFIDYDKLLLYKNGLISIPHLVIRKGTNLKIDAFVGEDGSYYFRISDGILVREFGYKTNTSKSDNTLYYIEKSGSKIKHVGISDKIVDSDGTHECILYSSANNRFRSDISKRPIKIEEKEAFENALIHQHRVFEFLKYVLGEYGKIVPGIISFFTNSESFRKMFVAMGEEAPDDQQIIVELLFYAWYIKDFSDCDRLIVKRTGKMRKRNA